MLTTDLPAFFISVTSVECTFSLPLPAINTGEADTRGAHVKARPVAMAIEEREEGRGERLNMAAEASAHIQRFLDFSICCASGVGEPAPGSQLTLNGKSQNECNRMGSPAQEWPNAGRASSSQRGG